ncbi:VOC family protein [Mycolicibacterium goodii]|uniref:VOC family protein n=1 Tax=Mycolicibacterium goodii TaxID=134601 RepID=UPI00256EF491|nr:VOC family protein [Mycolicibacterium goodii]
MNSTARNLGRERRALVNGGARTPTEASGEPDFRVFRDPAGHTFCLVFNIDGES